MHSESPCERYLALRRAVRPAQATSRRARVENVHQYRSRPNPGAGKSTRLEHAGHVGARAFRSGLDVDDEHVVTCAPGHRAAHGRRTSEPRGGSSGGPAESRTGKSRPPEVVQHELARVRVVDHVPRVRQLTAPQRLEAGAERKA